MMCHVLTMINRLAVALARLASHSRYGSSFLARNLAKCLPALRHYPLKTRYGRIYCNLGESVCLPLLAHGEYPHWRPDEEAINRIPLSPESVVLDIGANIGVMTRIFAARAGHVHAFEPAPRAITLLEANTADLANVTLHPVALSNHSGTALFAEREALDFSSLSDVGIKVPMRTVDSLELKPDLIKIDVEGYEHRVLEGSTETMKCSPVILFEAFGETARQYCENIILAANPGYRFETLGGGTNHIAWPTPT